MRQYDWLCILHSVTTFPDGGVVDDKMHFMSKFAANQWYSHGYTVKMDVCVTHTPIDKKYYSKFILTFP
jgi:hypothetical protein